MIAIAPRTSLLAQRSNPGAAELRVPLDCFVASLLAMTGSTVFMGSGLGPAGRPGMTGSR